MISLHVVGGPREGEVFELHGPTTIGRHGADILIDDERLSRLHVKLTPDRDGLLVEDLGSTNGTLLDDRRIEEAVRAVDRSRLRFGTTIAEVIVVVDATRPMTVLREVHGTIVPEVEDPAAVASPMELAAAEPVSHVTGSESGDVSRERAAPNAGVVAPAKPARSAESPLPAVFTPPSARRSRGLATRSWVPFALSYGSAIAAALALVIYFAQR